MHQCNGVVPIYLNEGADVVPEGMSGHQPHFLGVFSVLAVEAGVSYILQVLLEIGMHVHRALSSVG
jgi:hypothetical protein